MSENLETYFSKIKDYFSKTNSSIKLHTVIEDLNHYLKNNIKFLTRDWNKLKAGDSLPPLYKQHEPGTLEHSPLNF